MVNLERSNRSEAIQQSSYSTMFVVSCVVIHTVLSVTSFNDKVE